MKTTKLIVIMLFVTAIFCCKKETKEINDPNIDDRVVAVSLDGSSAAINQSIDLDSDGINDFNLFISHPGAILTNSDIGANGGSSLEFATETSGTISDLAKTFAKGSTINSGSGSWKSITQFYYFEASVSATKYGFSDVGAKYIGFRLFDTADYYYGWMLVNITTGNKISITEFGIQKMPNTTINAGAK